jgi:5'-nucleotidase
MARTLFERTTDASGPMTKKSPLHSKLTPLLNLNVPLDWTGEVRRTRLGARLYEEIIVVRQDPRGRDYMWLGGPGVTHEPDEGSDTDAYDACAASITPLLLDLTAPDDGGVTDRVVAALVAPK